jgi:hypothetical protein
MQLAIPKPLTILSIVTSAALTAAAAIFGSSRDFGMFLLGIEVVGGLLILALIVLGVATVADRSSRGIKASALLVLLAPIAGYAAAHLRDRVLFVGWSLSHPAALQAAAFKDSIITDWDSWGMAGSENDSYLISDKLDDSSNVASAERWRVRMGLDCPIAATVRMQKNIYIVTTYQCPLDAVVVGNGVWQ